MTHPKMNKLILDNETIAPQWSCISFMLNVKEIVYLGATALQQ